MARTTTLLRQVGWQVTKPHEGTANNASMQQNPLTFLSAGPSSGAEGSGLWHGDVIGEEIVFEEQHEIQRMICDAVLGQDNWDIDKPMHFPGSQPVSLSRSNLNLLEQRR